MGWERGDTGQGSVGCSGVRGWMGGDTLRHPITPANTPAGNFLPAHPKSLRSAPLPQQDMETRRILSSWGERGKAGKGRGWATALPKDKVSVAKPLSRDPRRRAPPCPPPPSIISSPEGGKEENRKSPGWKKEIAKVTGSGWKQSRRELKGRLKIAPARWEVGGGGAGGAWGQAGVRGRLGGKGPWAGEGGGRAGLGETGLLGAHLDGGAPGDSENSWSGGNSWMGGPGVPVGTDGGG